MTSFSVSPCGLIIVLFLEVKAAKILPTIPPRNQRVRMPIGRQEHTKLCSVLTLVIIELGPGNMS